MASSAFNFQENYLDKLDPVDALSLTRRVRVLHYAGSPKPWRAKQAKMAKPTMQLWRHYQVAAEQDGVFA